MLHASTYASFPKNEKRFTYSLVELLKCPHISWFASSMLAQAAEPDAAFATDRDSLDFLHYLLLLLLTNAVNAGEPSWTSVPEDADSQWDENEG
ncbi:hypothetical protein C5167_016587 [Papaver somniferum]|nr:hypothetical protein C5167_016587 [Papaver somniferum]